MVFHDLFYNGKPDACPGIFVFTVQALKHSMHELVLAFFGLPAGQKKRRILLDAAP